MKKNRLVIFGCCIVAAFFTMASQLSYSQQTASSEAQRQAQIMAFIRSVNTVEAEMFSKTHQYVNLQDVVGHKLFQNNPLAPSPTDLTSGTLLGYKISVLASSDGQHYTVAALPSQGCAVAVFSNESAVIYRASALGCPLMGLMNGQH